MKGSRAAVACVVLVLAADHAAAGEAEPQDTLRRWIIEGTADSPGTRVFLDLMGRPVRAKVLDADEEGVEVEAVGLVTRLGWADISPRRFFGLARRFAGKRPPAEQAALVEYARANGLDELAETETERLLALDPKLREVLVPEETSPTPAAPATSGKEGRAPPEPPPPPTRVVPGAGRAAARLSVGSMPQDHPRLFMRRRPLGDAATVARALARAKRGRGSLNRNNAAHMALEHLLSGNRSSADRAIELMKKRGRGGWYNAGRWTADAALAYDWLYGYDGFSEDDRRAAEDNIIRGLNDCLPWVRTGGNVHHIWNGYWICAYGAVCATVALHGHRQEATAAAQDVIDSVDRALSSLDCCDGAWTEGPTYAVHSINHMVPAAEALWSATGANPYERHPGLARFVHWLLWMTRPDWTFARWDDASGGSSCSTNLEPAVFAFAAARGSRDPTAAWFAQRLVNRWGGDAWYPEGYAHFMRLWVDEALVRSIARPPAKLSECFSPETAGFVMARSDWSDGAFHLVFRSGDSIAPGHQHYCANSFTVYHRAPLAIDSGEYHGRPLHAHIQNYAGNTIAHNAMVFPHPERPEEDAGQERRFRHLLRKASGLLNAGKFEAGRIIAYEDKGSYMYAAGDATRAYPSGFCRLWVRELVYLRPNILVVMDRVGPGPRRVPTWLMHFTNEPQVSGNAFTAEAGSARIWGCFLLPAEVEIRKVGGKGKEFQNKGKNWSPGGKPSRYHEPGAWRIEVTSRGGPGAFLAVIHTDRKGAPPPAVSPLFDDPGGVGARVAGRAVIFRRDGVGLVGVR